MQLLQVHNMSFLRVSKRSTTSNKIFTQPGGRIKKRQSAPIIMSLQTVVIPKVNSQRRALTNCQGMAQQIIQAVPLESLFSFSTYFALTTYFLMIALPNLSITKKFIKSGAPIIILTATYCLLLWIAYQQKQLSPVIDLIRTIPQLPDVAKFAQFFATMEIVVLSWCNVLILDLFIARELYLDGLRNLVPTRHTVLICCFVGPLGILCHAFTKYVQDQLMARKLEYALA
eukprot:TRINITY_DN2919_c1_g1_i3.p2 TRINITY_DN2919_c1_g1~~TRINITY_DN2919_c1_g1_i3.p2  ORF type:complete len:253 (-),score=17.40 TRINITY_DN2919_c1_g1_i3:832-1518(-)